MSINFNLIGEFEKSGKAIVICTIVECTGSCPRKEGAKMLVFPDGIIQGTIGGGSYEAQVIKDALLVLKNGSPLLLTYNLDEHQQMMCGGKTKIFFEPIKSKSRLIIFGSGHVGSALEKLAIQFGFEILIVDPREKPETITSNYLQDEYKDACDKLNINDADYIAVMTPSHQSDFDTIFSLIEKEYKYLGLLASRKKAKNASDFLKEKGINENIIQKIHMPIGLKFNAQEPNEIALSIMSQIIDIKNT